MLLTMTTDHERVVLKEGAVKLREGKKVSFDTNYFKLLFYTNECECFNVTQCCGPYFRTLPSFHETTCLENFDEQQ